MLIRQKDAFYVEHGGRRRGYYNARVTVFDAGRRDYRKRKAYGAEEAAELACGNESKMPNAPLSRYAVASAIDYIVTQPLFIEWFGATHLLLMFSTTRSCSRAWAGCIEFADDETRGFSWFDIYHELAHNVTLRDDEPHHGERFIGAMLLIASLSPVQEHVYKLSECLTGAGLYPTSKYFADNFCI